MRNRKKPVLLEGGWGMEAGGSEVGPRGRCQPEGSVEPAEGFEKGHACCFSENLPGAGMEEGE